jgi:uncharacterized membrane protein YvbJ
MTCPKCSTENPGHARFCGRCGHALARATASAAQPASGKVQTFFKWVGYFVGALFVLAILSEL